MAGLGLLAGAQRARNALGMGGNVQDEYRKVQEAEARRQRATPAGMQGFNDYVQQWYPDGNLPRELQQVRSNLERGYGSTDYGISAALEGDINYPQGGGPARFKSGNDSPRPGSVGMGLGGVAPAWQNTPIHGSGFGKIDTAQGKYASAGLSPYLARINQQPAIDDAIRHAQELGPTGLGALGPLATIAAGAFGGPAIGALVGSTFGNPKMNLTGAIKGGLQGFAAGGGFKPITDPIKNSLGKLNPFKSTPAAWTTPPHQGFDAWSPGGFQPIGSTEALWNAGGAWTPGEAWSRTTPPPGFDAWSPDVPIGAGNALAGGTGRSLGGNVANAAKGLIGGPQSSAGDNALAGGIASGFSAPQALEGGQQGSPMPNTYDAALDAIMAGGQGPEGLAANTGMGPGKQALSERDKMRLPGYQPRPFGNYLAYGV